MKSIIAILGAWLLSGVALSAPPQANDQQPTPKPPPKFLSYQDSDGQYSFGYSSPQSARSEYRTADGLVRGAYSYVDATGQIRTVEYEAGGSDGGFRIRGTNPPLASPNFADSLKVETNKLIHQQQVSETPGIQLQQGIKQHNSVSVQTPYYGVQYWIQHSEPQQQQEERLQKQHSWTLPQQVQQRKEFEQHQQIAPLQSQQDALPQKHQEQQYWSTIREIEQQKQLQQYQQMLQWQNRQAFLQQRMGPVTLTSPYAYVQPKDQVWSQRRIKGQQLGIDQQLRFDITQQQQLKAHHHEQHQQSLLQQQYPAPGWQNWDVPPQQNYEKPFQSQNPNWFPSSQGPWNNNFLQGQQQDFYQEQYLTPDKNQQQKPKPCRDYHHHHQLQQENSHFISQEEQNQYYQPQHEYHWQNQHGQRSEIISEPRKETKDAQAERVEDRSSNVDVVPNTYLPEPGQINERAVSGNAAFLDPEPQAVDSVSPFVAGDLKTTVSAVAGSLEKETGIAPDAVPSESHSVVQQNLALRPVVYTPEVMAAREAHFRAYDSAARLAIEADANPEKLQDLLRNEAVPQPTAQQASVAASAAVTSTTTHESGPEGLGTIVVPDRRIDELRQLAPPLVEQERPEEKAEGPQAPLDANGSLKQPKRISGFDSADTKAGGTDTRPPYFNELDQTKLKSEVTLICGTGLKVMDSDKLKGADHRLQVGESVNVSHDKL